MTLLQQRLEGAIMSSLNIVIKHPVKESRENVLATSIKFHKEKCLQ